ncbi:MAG: hypothetical protein JNJ48_05665 [Phycisphaerae bacterium]|nr:hypothetical protein [Phycisphaerae bacterium]
MNSRKASGAAAVVVLAALVLLAGCNILGPAGYFLVGPEATPAVFRLDPEKTAVVFVDDRANQVPTRSTREIIGRVAEEDMLANGAVKDMVQSRRVQTVIAAERSGRPLGIVEVGQAVQAKTVVYAVVERFVLSEDGQTYAPVASLRVKVIDVETDSRLFPVPDAGDEYYNLVIRVPVQTGSPPTTSAGLTTAYQDLARWTGRALGRMFYDASNEIRDSSRLSK